jgi:PAS domain S-box-containing protein
MPKDFGAPPENANQQKVKQVKQKPETELQALQRKLRSTEKELKAAQNELGRLSKLYDAAFYSSAQLASISDLETGRFIDVNDAWITTRGFSRQEVIGKTADELRIWGVDEERRNAIIHDIRKTGRLKDYETKSVMRNGEVRDFILNAEIICLDGRDVLFFSGVDITDRKRIDKHQHRTQKLQAIGNLSGGIAHDFNNLLGIIQGNLELATDHTESNSAAQKHINTALQCTDRGANITRKLLNFSTNSRADAELTNTNTTIRAMHDLIARSATASISIKTNLKKDLWPIKVDPGELEDTLINLCLNSRDAMPDGGTLTLKTENTSISADNTRQHPDMLAGDYVAITIEDTGHGIDPNIKDQIFEPFFTTKTETDGSGLGLNMVFGFIQRSKGHIKVTSQPEQGCRFTLFIPRCHEAETELPADTPAQEQRAAPRGSEKILIVDDEQGLVDLACQKLESLGYTVFSAFSGECALEILTEFPEIDLMLTDIVMPGELNGFKLAVEGRAHKACLKIILTSGYSRADELLSSKMSDKIDDLVDDILPKPYSMQQLAFKVRDTLDEVKKDRYIHAAS